MEAENSHCLSNEHMPVILPRIVELHKICLQVHESIHDAVREVVAKSRAQLLSTSQTEQIPERIDMPAFRAGSRRKQVRQQHCIIFGPSCMLSPVICCSRGKRPVPPLAKVLPGDCLLLRSENFRKCSRYEPQLVQVSDAAKCEYLDLKLDRETMPCWLFRAMLGWTIAVEKLGDQPHSATNNARSDSITNPRL